MFKIYLKLLKSVVLLLHQQQSGSPKSSSVFQFISITLKGRNSQIDYHSQFLCLQTHVFEDKMTKYYLVSLVISFCAQNKYFTISASGDVKIIEKLS